MALKEETPGWLSSGKLVAPKKDNIQLYGTMDFDYLSEALLPEQCLIEEQSDNVLRVGCMTYNTVVLPDMTTIRSSTLDILEGFCGRGGKVIFMGRVPELVDGMESERALRMAKQCICIRKDKNELLEALESERLLEIRGLNGCRSDNLFYQLRAEDEKDVRWLFVCHVNRKKNHISAPEHYVMKIKGLYSIKRYDTMTGEMEAVTVYSYENGWTRLNLEMYGEDSILLQLEAELIQKTGIKENETETKENAVRSCRKYEPIAFLRKPYAFRRTEPNALILDYAEYQLDDGSMQPMEEILRVDNQIRKSLGFVLRRERMNQPWYMQEKETHKVTLYYRFYSEIETKASLAIEDAEHSRISLNGKSADMAVIGHYVDKDISVISLPDLSKGENQLVVEVDYNQKSGLENLYVLGDFDVELIGNRAVVRKARTELTIGDITRQGMPFYTGNLDYIFRFHVDGEHNYAIHIPQFQAPVIAVYLDGEKKGLIAFAPRRLQLGNLSIGEHELTIRLYGNRFNGFGTLHNANEDFIWYGPDSYRTGGDDWTDCYMVHPTGILGAVELEGIPDGCMTFEITCADEGL